MFVDVGGVLSGGGQESARRTDRHSSTRNSCGEPQWQFSFVDGAGGVAKGGEDAVVGQCGVLGKDSSTIYPWPRRPTTAATGMRVPTMHGTPPMMRWSIVTPMAAMDQ